RRRGWRHNRFIRTRPDRWLRDRSCKIDIWLNRLELPLELGERAVELLPPLEGPAVPAILFFPERDNPPPNPLRQNHRGPALCRAGLSVRTEQRAHVVTIDDDRVPAEGGPASAELFHVVPPHRRVALAERIDVGDPAEVVDLVNHRDVCRFP